MSVDDEVEYKEEFDDDLDELDMYEWIKSGASLLFTCLLPLSDFDIKFSIKKAEALSESIISPSSVFLLKFLKIAKK